MYKRLLVAFDGSEQSYKALYHAISIAEKFGAELTLLTVVPRHITPVITDNAFGEIANVEHILDYHEKLKSKYQCILTKAGSSVRLEHPDLNVSTILREGRPSANIVDLAKKDGYDLIVMGSRGIGGIKGWIIGSTCNRVVDSCTKPIIIIK